MNFKLFLIITLIFCSNISKAKDFCWYGDQMGFVWVDLNNYYEGSNKPRQYCYIKNDYLDIKIDLKTINISPLKANKILSREGKTFLVP